MTAMRRKAVIHRSCHQSRLLAASGLAATICYAREAVIAYTPHGSASERQRRIWTVSDQPKWQGGVTIPLVARNWIEGEVDLREALEFAVRIFFEVGFEHLWVSAVLYRVPKFEFDASIMWWVVVLSRTELPKTPIPPPHYLGKQHWRMRQMEFQILCCDPPKWFCRPDEKSH